MKRRLILYILVAIVITLSGCESEASEPQIKVEVLEDDDSKSFADKVKKDLHETRVAIKDDKNGFSTASNKVVQVGSHFFSIPEYWTSFTEEKDLYKATAEKSGKLAGLSIMLRYDDEDPVTREILREETFNSDAMYHFFDGWFEHGDISSEECEGTNFWGIKYTMDITIEGLEGFCECYVIPSEDDNCWLYIALMQTDNTFYDYQPDFEKIIEYIDVVKPGTQTVTAEADKDTDKPDEDNIQDAENVPVVDKSSTVESETVSEEQVLKPGMDRDEAFDCLWFYIEQYFSYGVKIHNIKGDDAQVKDNEWMFVWPVTYKNEYGTKCDCTVRGVVTWDGGSDYFVSNFVIE